MPEILMQGIGPYLAHCKERRFLSSCTSILGFALLPKCPVCLGIALASVGFLLAHCRRYSVPLIAGLIAAMLILAGKVVGLPSWTQYAGGGLPLAALSSAHQRQALEQR